MVVMAVGLEERNDRHLVFNFFKLWLTLVRLTTIQFIELFYLNEVTQFRL
jgi:hypothetical protein